MTISSTNRKAGPFIGNDVTVDLPFTFKVFAASEVLAVSADTATGEETILALTTDYTVALNADQNTNPGGTVTMLVAPATGTTTTLLSQVENLQPTDLTNGGGFYPEVITNALDRQMIVSQQIQEKVDRSLVLAISTPADVDPSLPAPVASGFIGWDALGKKLVNYAGLASAAVSSVMMGFVSAASKADARTFLEVLGIGDAYLKTETYSDTEIDTAISGAIDAIPEPSLFQEISASVAANALTATLAPVTLDFRSATLTSGTPTKVALAVATSLTVPSGATLGTTSGQTSRLILLALNFGGAIEPAIVNLTGGVQLDESNLISTTALSAASDSANVVYSTVARTNVPYRVVGYIQSTQATAGTWATAPSLVQGGGGQAIAAMASLGYGQTWQSVTGSRTSGTTYYNTTGKPIVVAFIGDSTASAGNVFADVDGVRAFLNGTPSANIWGVGGCVVVPAGSRYVITFQSVTKFTWSELR